MTSLFGGKRVLKSDARVEAYGAIDELNSWVGFVLSHISHDHLQQFLRIIQSDLFTLGGTLAGWGGDLNMVEVRVKEMEHEMDIMEKTLPKLQNFILPGGSPGGAAAHVARSVCRRAERTLVALAQQESVDPQLVKYVNRLSDLFFMLARFINKESGGEETVWTGMPRTKK